MVDDFEFCSQCCHLIEPHILPPFWESFSFLFFLPPPLSLSPFVPRETKRVCRQKNRNQRDSSRRSGSPTSSIRGGGQAHRRTARHSNLVKDSQFKCELPKWCPWQVRECEILPDCLFSLGLTRSTLHSLVICFLFLFSLFFGDVEKDLYVCSCILTNFFRDTVADMFIFQMVPISILYLFCIQRNILHDAKNGKNEIERPYQLADLPILPPPPTLLDTA